MSKGLEVFQKQMGYIQRGDVDGMLRDQYTDDCEMVTFEFVLKGKEALSHYLKVDSPAKAGQIRGFKTVHLDATDDCVIFVAIVESEKLGRFIARDAFYLREDRIHRHISLTLPPTADRPLWDLELTP